MLVRQFTGLLLKGDYDGVERSKALGREMAKGKSWLKKMKVILHHPSSKAEGYFGSKYAETLKN